VSEKTQAEKFWIVWCPTGAKSPSFRHATYRDAAVEAERLARANAGQTFFVLGAETSLCSVAMHRVEYVTELPF